MALWLSALLLLAAGTPCTTEYWNSDHDSVNHLQPQQLLLQENSSTTPTPNNMEFQNFTMSPEDSFALNRRRAIQLVLGKVLRALGPEFEARLPLAPTNATLTPLNSSLRVETGTCPERYRRCSSQTFYPSCELPRNTDEQMWHQRFTLFFNISSEISSIRRNNILNATLRLYKLKLPLPERQTFIVKLHVFTKSLKRNRERSRAAESIRLSSDYEGWVFLNVASLVPRLKSRANHGFKISIQNERNVPWNIPDFFVKMDCKASNDSLIPLPFEVQLDDNTQRYPALNIRSGTQEAETDNDYLQGYENLPGHDSAFSLSHNLSPSYHRRNHQGSQGSTHHHGIGDSFNSRHIDRIQRLQQQDFDQWLNPHLYDAESSPSVSNNGDYNGHHRVMSDSSDYDDIVHQENDESHRSQSDRNFGFQDSWRSGETHHDHTYHDANGDPQLRYKKQAPHFLSNQQQADQQYYIQPESDRHYQYDEGSYDLYDEFPHGDEVKSDFVGAEDGGKNLTSGNGNNSTADSNLFNSLILRREHDYSDEYQVHQKEQAWQATASPLVLNSVETNRSIFRSENNQYVPQHFSRPYRRTNRHHHNHHNRRHHTRHHGNHHRHRRPHPHFGHFSRREEQMDDYSSALAEHEMDVITTVAPQ
ncbi:hypothetical protein FHG87_010653 [Trinorchestia longiramus]|nr:hypothetical protein FHG87_010653 [Trinorchestia longiramus]